MTKLALNVSIRTDVEHSFVEWLDRFENIRVSMRNLEISEKVISFFRQERILISEETIYAKASTSVVYFEKRWHSVY